MKKHVKIALTVVSLLALCIIFSACNDSVETVDPIETDDGAIIESDELLDFYLLDDGTFAVGAGNRYCLSEITVPETYMEKPITAVVPKGFEGAPNLKKIILPTSVKNIGEAAFANCESLECVVYGDEELTIFSVNGNVFSNSEELKLEYDAFSCTKLMQLSFKDAYAAEDTRIKFVLQNPIEGLTKISVTPKLNDVTDMFTTTDVSVENAVKGTPVDFGTYGRFKNIEITLYVGDDAYKSIVFGGVDVTASKYNFAYLNATYPVLVASLQMDEITKDGTIPTFVALERNSAYNWDNLPEGVSCIPTLTKAYATGGGFHERRSDMAAYIKELYEISPYSQFNLYVVDNYLELIVELLIANGIPEDQWNVVMLSDGTGTAAWLSSTFNVDDPYAKYEVMAEDWKNIKEYYYSKGSFDTTEDSKHIIEMVSAKPDRNDNYSVLARYAYVINKEQDNVQWWVNRLRAKENLFAINEKSEAFTNDIIASVISFNTNTLLAALDEEQTEAFKALYNFNGEMFSVAEEQGKKVMVILGTSWNGEKDTFYEQIKLTMKYYGDDYVYYYKGHPGYPTSLYPERQAVLERLAEEGYVLYELDNAIAAEVILFFYPSIYASGYGSTTFESVEDNDKAGILFNIPYADKDKYTYGSIMGIFATLMPEGTTSYDDIVLSADKKYCLLEYNNSTEFPTQQDAYGKHEIAIYNSTDDIITYYKSAGENKWTKVDAQGVAISN